MNSPVDAATSSDACLSVVMPCYNELATIEAIVGAVLAAPLVGELVIVDDCSTDGTRDVLAQFDDPRIRVILHEVNQGKGAALRTGFAAVTLPYLIVQDADLEYDPADYPSVLAPILEGKADVVYGSRFMGGQAHRVLYFWHSVGNRLLTTASNVMTNLNLTDMETCYKAFKTDVVRQFTIEENRFGVEPEITSKISRLNLSIFEVGISYDGRTYAEGKKIGWRDGIRAFFCIAAYSVPGERVGLKRLSPLIARLTGGRA
ncbi:MAG TPA: glycosyltransferase family 2 protein [Ilumatobacter sp.]|nr:glycosyltransferase family 2 protein [Ilumatobacter sp.]